MSRYTGLPSTRRERCRRSSVSTATGVALVRRRKKAATTPVKSRVRRM